MNEDTYIPFLFETARNEAPQLSYEDVSQSFQASLSPGYLTTLKIWLSNYSLNIFLLLVGITLALSSFFTLSWENEKITHEGFTGSVETFIIEPLAKQEIKKAASIPAAIEKEIQTPKSTPLLAIVPDEPKLSAPQASPAKDTLFSKEKSQNKSKDMLPVSIEEDSIQNSPKAEPHAKKLPEVRTNELRLVLLREYDAEAVQNFLNKLETSGLGIQMGRKFQKNNKDLHFFSIKFSHELGLDFELKGTGFQRFEIILQLDNKKQIQSFKYRFNEGEFTRRIPLTCIGYQTYLFGKGYTGKSGKSNVQIN